MMENEAIEELQTAIELAKMCTQNLERKREIQAYEMAIKALEEVQQYREIGTLEELRSLKENGAFTGMELAQLAAMQMRLKEYEKIGTPEEFRAAREKQMPKIVSLRHVRKLDGFDEGDCPTCGEVVSRECDGDDIFCPYCEQKLDWRDEE